MFARFLSTSHSGCHKLLDVSYPTHSSRPWSKTGQELQHCLLLSLIIRILIIFCLILSCILASVVCAQNLNAGSFIPKEPSTNQEQVAMPQTALPQGDMTPTVYQSPSSQAVNGMTAQRAVYIAPDGKVSSIPAGLMDIPTPMRIAYDQNQGQSYPVSQYTPSSPAQITQGAVYYPHIANVTQGQNQAGAFPLATTLDETDLKLLKELSKAQNSKSAKLNSKPFISKPGEVSFIFGASQPTVVCSLLHVCDIALEPGENVVDVKVGDSARWIIERSASGSTEGIIEHITIKPTDTNLQSNLRIYTDRRSYSIDLKSSTKDFMPNVTFVYPENTLQKYAQVKAQLQQQQAAIARNTVHMGQQAFVLTDLNFNYEVDGDKTIKPLRVFNDTHKTYIQMSPQLMRQNRLPALVVVHDPGGFFSDAKTAMINYRIIDNNFVVDGLPTHLRLILGQDSDQAASVDIKLQTP